MLMALAAGLTLVPTVMVDARDVTVGALVRTADGRRLSGTVAGLVALRLPAGQRSVALAAPAVLALVRRQAPHLQLWGIGTVVIALRSDAPARTCWSAKRPLSAGATVTTDDVEQSECGPSSATVATAGGVPVVRDAVPAGAMLGRLVPARVGHVPTGTPLTLRSTVGPVTIERDVTTLQPGHPLRNVFVRDTDGQVFAAPLVVEAAR